MQKYSYIIFSGDFQEEKEDASIPHLHKLVLAKAGDAGVPSTRFSMDFRELRSIFSGKRVLVIGDHYLDRNLVGSYEGFSRESESLPIFVVSREEYNPGGAGNLAANLASFGAKVTVAGVWSSDSFDVHRWVLERRFNQLGIDTSGMVIGARTPTFEKTYFPNSVHVSRLDVGSEEIPEASRKRLTESVGKLARSADIVIVADYDESGRGVCDRALLSVLTNNSLLTFGTSRSRIGTFLYFHTLVINEKELLAWSIREPTASSRTLDLQATSLLSITGAQRLIVTCGGKGSKFYQRVQRSMRSALNDSVALDLVLSAPSVLAEGKVDSCGCGDTFLAAFSLCFASSLPSERCLWFANAAARASAKKLFGAHSVSFDEVGAEYEEIVASPEWLAIASQLVEC